VTGAAVTGGLVVGGLVAWVGGGMVAAVVGGAVATVVGAAVPGGAIVVEVLDVVAAVSARGSWSSTAPIVALSVGSSPPQAPVANRLSPKSITRFTMVSSPPGAPLAAESTAESCRMATAGGRGR
jgi:hypothetical protein